ncbi:MULTISPECIES: Pup--protein ligase [unclassified Arthrobacter]|uniref:Pup--protein ligase n=1 Tax=unclassified Arthrobacter TaxID=235627 RepID=UPI001D159DF2|nr:MULTISPECIES: Pup--protein ligase [unclassified Arthrobacter]MCC3274773.1 Pup--protein ligase [Arthrobacter sp. zg-Y20]MCC3279258.1 Pup--protein ligase [Arthrobacter sp. zg-Y40]MCC9177634.1 Pup--protein ligase [Arthrobacter sp. zg-Y750]MDK1314929.1 Pup--protein ligase [Arthrobacter sp. zg.Y20]MDK1327790.1 Pup--protein ligase [Arthrobacter sp. zg-Y1143]
MDRRIYGVETEFGIAYSGPDSRPLSPEEVARYLFRKVVSWGRSSNVFLTNGSRLYLDVGSHPEYATAECDDLAQLVAHDRAGELILDDLVDEAEERLRAEGFNGSVYLFKNNTDSAGNSYGSHENYLIPRRLEFSRLADVLIPFLVTRQLLVGAGKVLKTQSGSLYAFSQRADHIWEGVSSATTRSRPIINTRDEPHADAEHYRRLHVIAGDSNMSETTMLLKAGSVDLMLRMIEAGVLMRDLRLENPIRSIRETSHDLSGRQPLKLANGSTMTPLDLQRIYLQRVKDFVSANGEHNRHTGRVVDLWERTLDAIESGDHSSIDTEIDWAIKKKLVDRYSERNGLEMNSPRLSQVDLTYHDISRRRGLFYLLQARGETARVVEDSDIKEAVDQPPQTTRAKLRGDFVRRAKAANRDFTVDWVHLKLNDRAQQTVLCKDPFASVDERVEALLSTL